MITCPFNKEIVCGNFQTLDDFDDNSTKRICKTVCEYGRDHESAARRRRASRESAAFNRRARAAFRKRLRLTSGSRLFEQRVRGRRVA